MSDIVIGVDAGGSHTEAVIADRRLTELARASGPPGAVRPGHASAAAYAIAFTVREALARAGVTGPAAALVAGAAGTGRSTEREQLERALEGHKLARRVEVTTDAAIALESAFHTAPGIVLVAGSGSIAYARDAAGVVWRVGGLGWQMGDEGSGYAIGRAALSAVGKGADGRGPATALAQTIAAQAGTTSLDDLVTWTDAADRRAVASLARLVCEAADAGDAVARTIIDDAARELCAHVRALLQRCDDDAPVRVAFAGRLIAAGTALHRAVLECLARDVPRAEPAEAPVDPPLGALALAARLAG